MASARALLPAVAVVAVLLYLVVVASDWKLGGAWVTTPDAEARAAAAKSPVCSRTPGTSSRARGEQTNPVGSSPKRRSRLSGAASASASAMPRASGSNGTHASAEETASTASDATTISTFKGEPTVGENHIIFVESSCAVNDTPSPASFDSESGLRLSPRAACAVEAAAAAHPDRTVYVVHTCAVDERALARGAAPPYALAALARPNVRLWAARFAHFFPGTPLEPLLASGRLSKSQWPVVHASDVLRILLIWKYGGTYLDLDVLMLRSMGDERNFGCAESTSTVSTGAFNLAADDAGRRVARAYLAEVLDFRPDLWSYNGPAAIMRALAKVCGTGEIPEMTAEKCGGFHLIPTSAFYAISWPEWKLFFEEENYEEVMNRINNSFAVHVWNYLSQNTTVCTYSKQPYALIAHQVCPSVIAVVGETM